MAAASTIRRTVSAIMLGIALTACSGGDAEPSTPSGQGCDALLSTLDEAKLESSLAPDLAKHDDSDGGATVTDDEASEIQQAADKEAAASDAATAAGCL